MSFKPYTDEEVGPVLDTLVHDSDLLAMMAGWSFPRLSRFLPVVARSMFTGAVRRRTRGITTIRAFQEVIAEYARQLIESSITRFEVHGLDALDPHRSYVYISNHRDIAGDSMLLNYALYLAGRNTVRIAVGDNLVQRSFATDIMKLNKSFFINRSGNSPRQVYNSLAAVSAFIRESLVDGESIWIAQAEGRAKDAYDRTDDAVLKMLHLADRRTDIRTSLNALNIVPMSLSYEFDPCDVAKARELTIRAAEGRYVKAPGEDLKSLVSGLTGFKGRVTLRLGEVFRATADKASEIAAELDAEIVRGLELFPINYHAAQKLDPDFEPGTPPTAAEVMACEARFAACDGAWRDRLIEMYANPVRNRERALSQTR